MVAPPPAARGGGASVVVKRGSGVTVVSAAAAGAAGWDADWDAIADVPVDVEVLKFDARRDLDARGRRLMGVGVREDVSEHGEWKYARASLDGLIGDLCAPSGTPAVAFPAGCLLDAEWMPGVGGGLGQQQQQSRLQEEPDVFGDRHCYGDDCDDRDDASLEGDAGTDMELDGDDG